MRSPVILLLVLILASRAGLGHPFHVSVAEAEFNAATSRIEIALRVHPDDLERALEVTFGERIDLEKPGPVDERIADYLGQVLFLEDGRGGRSRVRWVGKEVGVKEAWLYFELELPPKTSGAASTPGPEEGVSLELTHRLFHEILPDQWNTVNLIRTSPERFRSKEGDAQHTAHFTVAHPTATLEIHPRTVEIPASRLVELLELLLCRVIPAAMAVVPLLLP